MDILPVDDDERLYLASAIDDWSRLDELGIRVVLDLEEGLDAGVPTLPGSVLYVYYHINDGDLPDLDRFTALARFGADLYRSGHRVLSHCSMGLNRSALLAGKILVELGWDGPAAVARLQERRPGALYNETFHDYLMRQRRP